ncbi:30185_t:CDS:2 [Gigaspora margarita]|uniref:30185_t:CDS:1 n=1 Tax=Gigaspora margarita TaxID=4874 RepID=A0ABN7USJ3_GIGMA|nr:30185_t:CDS:2 [Gigaspora margarita]
MSNQQVQKQKGKENKTPNNRSIYCNREKLRKQERKNSETAKKRKTAVQENTTIDSSILHKSISETIIQENITNDSEILSEDILNSQLLTDTDRKLLKDFCSEINKLRNSLCSTYNERFPSINIVIEECQRCYMEKNEVKKFSFENNMDPGDVPKELKDLTEVEEMLIAQIFPVVSVYYLYEGQYAYRRNVINFLQDVNEFVTQLPRHPLTVELALCWLKENNRYYKNIVIDDTVLQTLPFDGSVVEQLLQLQNEITEVQNTEDELQNFINDELDSYTNTMFTHNFVPAPAPSLNEQSAINEALTQIQAENNLIS